MRFLIDVTDLRSPLRNKYTRVIEKLQAEAKTGNGLSVEIAAGAHQIMSAPDIRPDAGDFWDQFDSRLSCSLSARVRATKLLALLAVAKLFGFVMSEKLKDGLAWQFAYSIEGFSPASRRKIAYLLNIQTDVSRLADFYFWLGERGVDIGRLGIAESDLYDDSRSIAVNADDALILAGISWRYDFRALAKQKAASGFRLICFIYDLLPVDYPSFVSAHQRAHYKMFLSMIGSCADLILAPNNATAERLRSFFAEQNIQPLIEVVSVSSATLKPSLGGISQRLRSLNLAERKFMLCVSSLRSRKHLLWLHALCAKLGERKPDLPLLVIAGQVAEARVLEILVADDAWEKSSIFVENASDAELSWLYEHAALCLQPSFEGGLGMAVMEAVGYECACIAANAPSLIEASGGLAVHLPRDEEVWTETICRLLIEESGMDKKTALSYDLSRAPSLLQQIEAALADKAKNVQYKNADS